VARGLDFLDDAGMPRIRAHVAALAARLVDALRSLRHRDGSPLVRVYGPPEHYDRGGTVAFNVLDASGDAIPFAAVEGRARAARISVRGGCFCNPGASEAAFEFVPALAGRALEETRRAGWSLPEFADRMRAAGGSHAVGAVRASFGISSTSADADRLVALIESMRER
jgi:selenocysteine lyase/cysteine desulfurase